MSFLSCLFLPVATPDKWRPIISKEAIARVFCEKKKKITFRRRSIATWGRFNFAIQKLCTPRTVVLYDYARYDRKKRNRRMPLSGCIHIWLVHFACDSYTMRSIGSCRLLLPLSDCGTSACLFPPSFCPDEIPTYPHIFISVVWKNMRAFFGEFSRA